jgi:ribosomal protein S18 acetylase RimI-like enzyme
VDALVPQGMTPAAVCQQVQDHFAQAGGVCRRWVLNPSVPSQQTQPLAEELVRRKCTPRSLDVLHLPRLPQSPVHEVGGLRVIPARASYKHWRALAEQDASAFDTMQLADAAVLHLDDPRFDAILALKDGDAAAAAGVLGAGEIAGVQRLFVSERFRRQGIGRTMMSRVLEICVRSLYRHVLLRVSPENVAAQALYRELGFEMVGQWVEYISPVCSP